jgi:hypothetical protein
MKTYEFKTFVEETTYLKRWLTVEAESENEAWSIIKDDPHSADYVDEKLIEIVESRYVDQNDWEMVS